MFNAGVRGKRAKDGVGFLSTAEQFNQKSFLVPTVTSFSITDVSYVPLDNTAVDTAGGEIIVINGSGFAPGATVQVGATTIGSVTYIDQNRLAFAAPALSSGSYTIYVTNSNGGTGILLSGLVYSGLPTYTTTAGTLGTIYETANINTAVVATGDAPITYSVISGTLPSGATLNSNGTITGNAPVDGSSTTYSFTIQASDAQLQDSTRAFTLTISTDVLTWGLANNTVYSLDGDTTMSNVTLSATSSANSNSAVTFAANTLPTGVSLSGNTIFGTPTTEQTVYSTLTATATQTGRTATRFVSWVVSVSDLFFKYNTLAIQGADTTFVDDASTNNFAVTINGDTKPNSFNPYTPGYYSAYCATGGNYLTFLGTNILPTGTENFTFELWFNRTNAWNIGGDLCSTQGTANAFHTFVNTTAGSIRLSSYNTVFVIEYSYATIALNTWHHLAITRSGNNFIMWLNGVSVATATNAVSFTAPGSCWIGSNGFTGNISNLRVIRGTALYSVAFTPSTTPLTAVSGTSLLACQSNRWIDNSLNNVVITPVNSATIQSFDPFIPNSSYSAYGSGYFDGTGDYLTAPSNAVFTFGTGDFTIEGWFYVNSLGANGFVAFDNRASASAIPFSIGVNSSGNPYLYDGAVAPTGSSGITVSNWAHIAWVRTSGVLKMFVNGVSVYSAAYTTNLTGTNATFGGGIGGLAGYGLTGYMSDFRLVKGTAVYTTAFTPPSAPLTAIANTSLLTLQNNQSVNNNVFLDNSSNNFFVTRNGNTTQGTFSPYGGNWSNYFDGTGDYLSVPDNAAWNYGAGNFTIEFWVLFSAFPNSTWMVQLSQFVDDNNRVSIFFGNNATSENGLVFKAVVAGTAYRAVENDNANITMASLGYSTNTWYHVAISRSGSSFKGFINGVQKCSLTSSGTLPDLSAPLIIGAYNTTPLFVQNGYISNLRIVKGTALYTTTFTPSTTPLTPITNTVLLTCADNRLIDDGPNNFTITKNGDVSVQRFSPFNPSSITPTSYSGYFDGTGDYLSVPANTAFDFRTGDFTIECWIYAPEGIVDFSDTVLSKGQVGVVDFANWTFQGSGSGGNLNFFGPYSITYATTTTQPWLTGWAHLAMCRSGSNTRCFLNGTQVGTTYTTLDDFLPGNPVIIGSGYYDPPGRSFKGYISNVRLVKGTALYTTNFTPSVTPLTAIANTSLLTLQSTTFIDNSTYNYPITAFGNSQPRIQNPFGYTSTTTNGYTPSTIGGSGYFDGTGDSLSIPAGTYLQFTGNYTIEFWIYFTSVAGTQDLIANYVSNAAPDWTILISPSFQYYPSSAASYVNGPTPVANRWYHVAAVRSGTTCSMYIDGVSVGTPLTFSGTLGDATRPAYIGSRGGSSNFTNGYMSDVRITKSALYTSNFVPPSAPLTAVQNTVLLTNMTGAGIYDAAMMNNMETVGDAKLSTAVSKFGGSSMYFDGTGDYAVQPTNINFGYGTGDFTIEFWLYMSSVSTDQTIVSNLSSASSVNPHIYYLNNTGIRYYTNNAERITGSSLSPSTWYHIAVCRASGSTKMFINGTQTGSTYTDANNYGTSAPLGIGTYWSAGSPVTTLTLNGYIDDLRITKGYARYTSNFTPPTTTFKIK